jgi:hypothetical protein
MPRKPFERKMKFGGKVYSYHSYAHSKKLANEKAQTLRNKGLLARVHRKKSTSGGYVYAVYERLPKKSKRKRGYIY